MIPAPRRPVLAIDSSTRGGSVEVGVGGRAAAVRVLAEAAGAASLLMPAVDEAMRDAGLRPRDLGGVAVGGGPGSFTGIRIAAATAKALVRALGVPLYAFSGLQAAAAVHRSTSSPVCALFDARNREVFAGAWTFADDGPREVLAPAILRVDELADALPAGARFTGDGAAAYGEALVAAFGPGAVLAAAESPPAAGLLWLAAAAPEAGLVADPATWEPAYLRASGAERMAVARGG